MKKVAVIVIILIGFINLPPVNWITGPDDIFYSNGDGAFTFDEYTASGRNYILCLRNFKAFKLTNPKDTTLYRLAPKNILKFWRWGNYFADDKYKLPYKSWDVVEVIRGPIQNKTAWQSF